MRLDAKINQDPNEQNYKLSTNYTPTYSLIKVRQSQKASATLQ